MDRFKTFIEGQASDAFRYRMRQFVAASQGVKGAITDDREKVPTYQPPARPQDHEEASPIQWIQMRDGFYEKMSPEDEVNGLTTLSRYDNPGRDGSYYRKRNDGRFVIVRPHARLSAINRKSI